MAGERATRQKLKPWGQGGIDPHLPLLQPPPHLLQALYITQPNREPEGKIGLPGRRAWWERMEVGSEEKTACPARLHSTGSCVGGAGVHSGESGNRGGLSSSKEKRVGETLRGELGLEAEGERQRENENEEKGETFDSSYEERWEETLGRRDVKKIYCVKG